MNYLQVSREWDCLYGEWRVKEDTRIEYYVYFILGNAIIKRPLSYTRDFISSVAIILQWNIVY